MKFINKLKLTLSKMLNATGLVVTRIILSFCHYDIELIIKFTISNQPYLREINILSHK